MTNAQAQNVSLKSVQTRFLVASFASLALAVLTLPYITLTIIADNYRNTSLQTVNVLLSALLLLVFAYQLMSLKLALNMKSDFHGADNLISILIMVSVILYPFQAMFGFDILQSATTLIILVFFIPKGVLLIMIGAKLQKCQSKLPGELRWISLFMVVSGTCFATVFFHLIGTIAYMVVSTLFSLFFLNLSHSK